MIRRAFLFFAVLCLGLAIFVPTASADPFGATGGSTRYGDYGPGHGAASWGEFENQTSFCFSGFGEGARNEIRFGMNQVDLETSNMQIGEFGCNNHVDVVFIECTSNCPPGGTKFTPTTNYLGVTDGTWVVIDVPLAYAYLSGINCGGGVNGFDWYLRYIAMQGAGIALGLHQSTTSNDAMENGLSVCSWAAYIYSDHHDAHIASWQ